MFEYHKKESPIISLLGMGGGIGSYIFTAADTGYEIARSLRFDSSSLAYLNHTPASAGNRRTFTLSFWCKLVSFGSRYATVLGTGTTWDTIWFEEDTFRVFFNTAVSANIQTTQLFRDPSAWYHFVVAVDTTQATESNRIKIYVNGSQITTFSASSYPSLNYECSINSTNQHTIGRNTVSDPRYFDGYLADVWFIDGSALEPTSFGTFDTYGVWQPKRYTGSATGNSFHLPFSDNTSATTLGYDDSGNNNNWDVNGISVTDGVSTIATATGALPILNTDSTGETVQSGLRSDSNATYLKLAVAGGTASGLNLTDQNVSGRSASNAGITNSGVTGTTSSSKFYGGSASVTNGSYFTTAVHSDFDLGGTWTIEFWAKPDSNAAGDEKTIIGYGVNASNGYVIMVGRGGARFRSNGTSDLVYTGSITDWTHFAFVASGGNTKRIFVNGNLVASGSGTVNAIGGYATYIGSPDIFNSGFRFTGEFQDVRFYNGLAKYSASFIAPNTYYASIDAGNDSLLDSPSNADTTTTEDTGVGGEIKGNYCTWNPLVGRYNDAGQTGTAPTFSNGNLDVSGGQTNDRIAGTFHYRVGGSEKVYWEVVFNGTPASSNGAGVRDYSAGTSTQVLKLWYYDGSTGDGGPATSFTSGNVLGFAMDLSAGTINCYKDGSYVGQMNISSLTTVTPFVSPNSGVSVTGNFGQRAYSHAAPSGYKALCTANLPTPTIEDGSQYVGIVTGNFDTTKTWNVGFQPDLIWMKSRGNTDAHVIQDSVNGTGSYISIANTAAATSFPIGGQYGITSFNSNGWTQGSWGPISNTQMVAWTWKAGGNSNTFNVDGIGYETAAAAGLTGGDVTPTAASVGTEQGFSIIKYTGSGGSTGKAYPHGLGKVPKFYMIKNLTTANTNWVVYHQGLGNTKAIYFDGLGANTNDWWDNTSPTTNYFYTKSASLWVHTSGEQYIAYVWADVPGLQKFGTYTGNGSTDGPFVELGFRPAFVMLKSTTTFDWYTLFDSERTKYNPIGGYFDIPSSNRAEQTASLIDFLSNGFKLRFGSGNQQNGSGVTYIYAAFAENPFRSARAR